jgi:predicted alpha/beta-hydrolase family hydrolase
MSDSGQHTTRSWTVRVGDAQTSAAYEPATTVQRAVFVCAHGAGGHMADRGLLATVSAMRLAGLGVVRFNFLYKERGSGRPDTMPGLQQCFAAVVDRVRQELGTPQPLLIGGRSMGGRAASMMAADGYECDGLLLLAYPLHPAGQPAKLRDAHLPRIRVPVLCVNGTRDALCSPELMERALETVQTAWTMHWLQGADHSFHVLKTSGRTDADVLTEVTGATERWLAQTFGT